MREKACVFKSYLRGILSISSVFIYYSSLENKVGVFNFFFNSMDPLDSLQKPMNHMYEYL